MNNPYTALDQQKIEDEIEVGIGFKVKNSFRTKANISAQILEKSVTQICIEALEQAIAEAGLAAWLI